MARAEKRKEQGNISDEEKPVVVERPGTAEAVREIAAEIDITKIHEMNYGFTRAGKSHRTSWVSLPLR